jgi:hypothetical protein
MLLFQYLAKISPFPTLSSLFSHANDDDKALKNILESWEYATCKGSEFYQIDDLESAIHHFERALISAQKGLKKDRKNTIFMHYYALASMNLAHVLAIYKQQPQSEKVLSDAHFNLLTYMVDTTQPKSFRKEAKQQAEVLLVSLKKFLVQIGKKTVAESLEDEFHRLTVNSQLGRLSNAGK